MVHWSISFLVVIGRTIGPVDLLHDEIQRLALPGPVIGLQYRINSSHADWRANEAADQVIIVLRCRARVFVLAQIRLLS